MATLSKGGRILRRIAWLGMVWCPFGTCMILTFFFRETFSEKLDAWHLEKLIGLSMGIGFIAYILHFYYYEQPQDKHHQLKKLTEQQKAELRIGIVTEDLEPHDSQQNK